MQRIRAFVSSWSKSLSFKHSLRRKHLSIYPECRYFCRMSLYQYCLHVVRLLIRTCTEKMHHNCMRRTPIISRDIPPEERVATSMLLLIMCISWLMKFCFTLYYNAFLSRVISIASCTLSLGSRVICAFVVGCLCCSRRLCVVRKSKRFVWFALLCCLA